MTFFASGPALLPFTFYVEIAFRDDLAVSVNSDVHQQGIAADSVVDVGLALLVKVDDLSIAAALEVEHALVIPSVLVITNEQTLWIG